ncbi:MAG: hypothetical protein AB8C95_12335 [Phycisphaeraceae bacterium]
MNDQACNNSSGTTAALRVMCCGMLALTLLLVGCKSGPDPDAVIPLPGFGNEGPAKPKGVYAVIRRADVPLDESSDEAWSIINEQIVPPVTRGTWRGNGMRIGLLQRDQLDRYSAVMPKPVAFSRLMINRSVYPVPIVETPRLRGDLRFQMDLTQPPRPRNVENVQGGDSSTLRLLAKIETEADGRHTLVLTPMHHIPSPLNLIPRDPLQKELDGRIFEELSLRVTLGKDQIAVVGLHWPWPIGEAIEEDEPNEATEIDQVLLSRTTSPPLADPSDPAAPPTHLRPVSGSTDESDDVRPREPQPELPGDLNNEPTQPRYERIAPPLATSFGSTLLTGTRIRQPVRTVLLITIEDPTVDQPVGEDGESSE